MAVAAATGLTATVIAVAGLLEMSAAAAGGGYSDLVFLLQSNDYSSCRSVTERVV